MKDKKKMRVIIAVSAALLIVLAVVFDVVSSKTEIEKTDFAMGAVISQKITGRNADETADEIISSIKERENAISWRIENSEIALLNKNKEAEISDETVSVLTELIDVCRKSSGAVDLTIGKLTSLWNIGSENFTVPEKEKISENLDAVSWKKVEIKDNTITIDEKQKIDLGFAGKGLACDDAKRVLDANNITEAIINVGGSLCLYGKDNFTVGLRNPLGDVSDYMAVITIGEGFVSTSGNYERFSESDGKKYHHIISTETGYPVENDLLSVTVVCNSGLLSDALSTACYCLGYEKSLELLSEYDAEAIFIFDSKTVRVTDGLRDKTEIKNDEFKLWKEN